MLTKIDWFSLTVKSPVGEGDNELSARARTLSALHALMGDDVFNAVFTTDVWHVQKGRTPYSVSWQRADNGFVLFCHPRLDHALLEVSGRGCDWLTAQGIAWDFLDKVQDRLTRIDVATDMLTDTDPLAFAALRDGARFKSHSEFVSESGTTAYIGSKSSNRYARVYRYNPPHERAHLLRCEVVLKAEDAKATAKALLLEGLSPVARALGEAFGWTHPDWQPDATEAAVIDVWRPERREGKTLYWLSDTIAPLLARLHNEGVTDVRRWWADNVEPKLDNPDAL